MNRARPIERVLQVHTRYRYPGGEDRVVAAERLLLEQAGIDVQQIIFDNADLDESQSIAGDVRIAISAIWSRSAERRVRAALAAQCTQVMHVHNTYAAASPSIYRAASAHGAPVVQTLHNYRIVCPAATAFRDGHACTDCVGRAIPWPAVLHSCVRGSRSQSAVAATTLAVHRGLGTFDRKIDCYIALTRFQRELMIRGGLPDKRICVIPNFLEPDPGTGDGRRSGVFYAGRLSEEKGVGPLIDAAAVEPSAIRVAGTGPMSEAIERSAAAGYIEYLGAIEPARVPEELKATLALIVPSLCFEGFPMAVVEAYATGTPVIASRIGSLAELVEDGVTGMLVTPGAVSELAGRIRWAIDHPTEMGEMGVAARQRYETHFRGSAHLNVLLDTYEALVRRRVVADA